MSTAIPSGALQEDEAAKADWSHARNFLETIIDTIPCMVFIKNASDLTFVRVNRTAQDLLGVSATELIGGTDADIFSVEDAVRISNDDRAVLASGQTGQLFEEIFDTRKGRRRFCTQKVILPGASGLPASLITFSEDVTEQKELRTAAQMWEQVFHHAERGMVIGSPDGTTLELMNPAFARMLGYDVEELAGTPLQDIFAPEARSSVAEMFELVRISGQHTFESVQLRKDGTTFPVLVDATAVKDARGNVHYRAIQVQDISLLKSSERVLRADRAEADRSNLATNEFLARMSHELRTPLNVVLGFAQVLQLDELNESQEESVGHILQAGRDLLTLVDEALDITRVRSGQMAFSLEAVSVFRAVENVFGLLGPMAERQSVRLVNALADAECHVLADPHRLKQVLLNLITNGIKYNVPGGELHVECAVGSNNVAICVRDTGIGVPEGATERLFAPFDRLGREGSGIEGTGLGLSLSKGIAEGMGGSLSATRNSGPGSTFTVRLRRSEVPVHRTVTVSGDEPEGPATSLILYIEDNLSNFRLFEQVLARRPGLRVLPAMQAGIGLQFAADHRPDLIFLDLQLPDMHGEQVLQRLLDNPLTREIPVIIASVDASPRRLDRLLRLGARASLAKPLDIALVLETIDQVLAESGPTNPQGTG